MLDMIAVIDRSLVGKGRVDFDNDYMLQLAIQRAIEIVSEASRHIPSELLEQAPEVPWPSIRGMGNILRHQYHRIVNDVIWDVVIHDLPILRLAILSMKTRL
ncbi:hypothetical protein GV67_00410 [Pseudorhizobium pelagicum]|uniref:DUF86 domain-containing protein n=3 Tax=Pseudorhizobium pelagicum TaxID=1509405 RepID=A0A922T654_9HYPH|nr:hypothetical protein GV67_00410 [Pseudorhizobium pelagicum]KEQ11010.1 hypothetical protein GV68_01640 [Pseudorhizobium pelagicum]